MNPSRLITSVLALTLSCGWGLAQTPALDSGAAPSLELSSAQKQTVYQSVTKSQKNNTAPTGFRSENTGKLSSVPAAGTGEIHRQNGRNGGSGPVRGMIA